MFDIYCVPVDSCGCFLKFSSAFLFVCLFICLFCFALKLLTVKNLQSLSII